MEDGQYSLRQSCAFPGKHALPSSTRWRRWHPKGREWEVPSLGEWEHFPWIPPSTEHFSWIPLGGCRSGHSVLGTLQPSPVLWIRELIHYKSISGKSVLPRFFDGNSVISSKNQLLLLPREWGSTVGSLVPSFGMLNISRVSSTSALQMFLGYPSREQVFCHRLQILACGGKQK